ncbi:PDZ domain-containing protein [Flavobacterium terrigena]|uniref:PDZ domain-containing protein n=1 Tax=Flavobacterium terrigena TaxID=402734 RepID=A0A1H6RWU9_9FLAO|nr:PDZ domain-containing protein [Flavobacterium terrigena]SEI60211.1 PDZ domain-containing protein [Flavobacterium terrigena]
MKKIIFLIAFLVISCKSRKVVSSFDLSSLSDSVNIEYDSHIYIKSNIANVNANFLFDTGADGLYLDSVFIAKSKVKFGALAYGKTSGVGIKEERIRVIRDSIYYKINNFNLKSPMTPILQLRPIIGKKIDGIIGNATFTNKTILIDYINQKLFVFKSFNEEMVKDFKKISIRKVNNRYFVNASINAIKDTTIEGDFMIDLGAGCVIDITNETAVQNALDDKIVNQVICNSSNAGIGGFASFSFFTTKSISLSDFGIKKEIICYSNNKTGALSDRSYVGLIGNGFFERFDVILDFENKYMYLRPNANYHKKPINYNLGFSYIDRTDIGVGFIVTSLFEGSDVEKKGLKLGDIITHVNDVSMNDIKDFSILNKAKNNQKIKLKFSRNNISHEIYFITNDLF